jgi:hypothetical protein
MAKRLKWGTVEYLEQLIDEYFANTKVPTLAGLCLHLNISKDTWNYYVSDKWRTHRMEGEELEKRKKEAEQAIADGILTDDADISAGKCILEEFSQKDRRENDRLKARVSEAFKKAKLRYESFIEESIQTNKNPAGPIFLAKATLGYRETPPEAPEQGKLPQPITIMVLPPPEKPQTIDAIEAQFQVIDENPQSLDTTALQKKLR